MPYPNIIFGVDNEPKADCSDATVWTAMNHAVQTIRNQESVHSSKPHLISVQARNWTADASYYIKNPITAGNGLNILYEVHIYDYHETAKALSTAQNLPLLVGEYGPGDYYANQGFDWETADYLASDNNLTIDQASGFAASCKAQKIPIIAWSFDEFDAPSMLRPAVGQPNGCNTNIPFFLTSWGNLVQSELATSYGLPANSLSTNSTISPVYSTMRVTPAALKADGKSTALISINLQTPFHQNIANQPVSITVSGSNNSLSSSSGTTNSNGIFQTLLSSTVKEQKIITATSGAVQLVGSVSFTSLQSNTIVLSPESQSIAANGYTVLYIDVSVTDPTGRPLANANMNAVTSSPNNIYQFTPTLDANGMGWVRIHGDTPAYVITTVSVGSDSASTTIQVTPAYRSTVTFTPSTTAVGDGNSKIWMQVNYSSDGGSPGVDQPVQFSCYMGANITPLATRTDGNGNVSAYITYSGSNNLQCNVFGGSDPYPNGGQLTFTSPGQTAYIAPERDLSSSALGSQASKQAAATTSN